MAIQHCILLLLAHGPSLYLTHPLFTSPASLLTLSLPPLFVFLIFYHSCSGSFGSSRLGQPGWWGGTGWDGDEVVCHRG